MARNDQSEAGFPQLLHGAASLPGAVNCWGSSRHIRSAKHLLALASLIEPDAGQCSRWWRQEGIEELGGFTADELVCQGANHLLENFLMDILRGTRD